MNNYLAQLLNTEIWLETTTKEIVKRYKKLGFDVGVFVDGDFTTITINKRIATQLHNGKQQ